VPSYHPPGAHDDLANAACGALLAAVAKKPEMRTGYIDVDGFVHWHDDEPREHSRVRIVHMTERQWLEQKEKEHIR
jgi:hypothetical protein